MRDFFISHSSEDMDVVNNIVSMLDVNHFTFWQYCSQLSGGVEISQKIKEGIQNTFATLLIVTANFYKTHWTAIETSLTLSQQRRIIPIFVDLDDKEKKQFLELYGYLKYLVLDSNFIKNLKIALNHIKSENPYLVSLAKLQDIQEKFSALNNIKAEKISDSIKSYLDTLQNNSAYAQFVARECALIATQDFTVKKDFQGLQNIQYNQNLRSTIKKSGVLSENYLQCVDFIFSNPSKSNEEYFKLLNNALYTLLSTYLQYFFPINLVNNNLVVADCLNLTISDFQDMYEIDKLVFPKDLIASVQTAYSWYKYNNYTHIAVRDKITEKIIGYFTLLPITNNLRNLIMTGDFKDKDFTVNDILMYDFPTFHYLYIAAVAIHPEYQNSNVLNILYKELINLMISLAEQREIYFKEILAEASTNQGKKFCEIMGMHKLLDTKNNTEVYSITLIPPHDITDSHILKRVKHIYKEI